MAQELTPEQALQALQQATGEARLTRQEHVVIQDALALIGRIINEYNDLKRENTEKTK